MKKLKFLIGGQPFRSTDFKVIQDAINTGLAQVLGTAVNENVILLSGVTFDFAREYTPAQEFTIPEGYLWNGQEICRIPQATFNYDSGKQLYLRSSTVETSQRSVGGSSQYVMEEVLFELVYVSSPEQGDILLQGLKRLIIASYEGMKMIQVGGAVSLKSGFTPVTGSGLYFFQNAFGDNLIYCRFSATAASGELITIPSRFIPPVNIPGWYLAGNTMQPLMLKTNGPMEVYGASTSQTNEIMYCWKTNFNLSL